jgi:hypothetical protein
MVKQKKNNLLVINKNLALLVMLVMALNANADDVNKTTTDNKQPQDTLNYSDFIQKLDSTFIVFENQSKSDFNSYTKQKQQEYETYKKQKQNEYNMFKKQAQMPQK